MALAPSSTTDHPVAAQATLPARRRTVALGLVGAACCAAMVWIWWRIVTLQLHLVPLTVLLLELAGFVIGGVVVISLVRARDPRSTLESDRSEPRRYAFAVADLVGRTRTADLRRDVRSVARAARRPTRRDAADVAVACVLVDGPRRLAIVAIATLGLLVGVAPMPMPSAVPAVALAIVVGCLSLATWVASGGRIRIGDRLRWTYSSLGEIIVRDDLDGVAPRRWVGAMGTIVVVNLAVALRGMSDRWTHGLPAMDHSARVAAMVLAMSLAAGALFTLATSSPPELDNAHLVARRLEERTARQSVLAAALCVGLIGLLAGVLPGSVDAAEHDSDPVEQISHRERDGSDASRQGIAVDD